MMRFFTLDPVGFPGLLALALGGVLFVVALIAARRRAVAGEKEVSSQRAPASWAWIAVQGVAIGLAGAGRLDLTLAPGSPRAIIDGVVVLALMIAAVGLFDAASRAMGKNWALVARTRTDHTLVQTGPFGWVRHPIYVALFLFMVAMAIAYGHSRHLVASVPLYAFATWMRVRHEERLLRSQFGAAYDAYAARVKRFVPGLF
jgi:protein-S-isoprenylcysteine O-methyltransferase Ste14